MQILLGTAYCSLGFSPPFNFYETITFIMTYVKYYRSKFAFFLPSLAFGFNLNQRAYFERHYYFVGN